MQQFEHKVQSSEGIHARPAMMLTQYARSLPGNIRVTYADRTANAENMMQLIALHAGKDALVRVTYEGPDEEEVIKQIKDFFKMNI